MGRKYQGDTLYWRILRNGKYTWKKADSMAFIRHDGSVGIFVELARDLENREEESP